MPIHNYPIIIHDGQLQPITLPIKIINPHTGRVFRTNGLVDTGAYECAIPATIATMLGHDLQKGTPSEINTGNGKTVAFKHTTSVEIFHPQDPDNQLIYTLDEVLIDCMPNLPVVLLGVNGFLSNFRLNIDYLDRRFSLQNTTKILE